jgi:hypothetical protein
MIAKRFAIRDTPIANMIVTAAGNPSGIAATANATDAMNISTGSRWRTIPTKKAMTAIVTIAATITLPNSPILRVSGV